MKNNIIISIVISLILGACCTKKECISSDPIFQIHVKTDTLQVLEIEEFYNNHRFNKKTYQFSTDTILNFNISLNDPHEIVVKNHKTINDTIRDFNRKIMSVQKVKCNDCFLIDGDELIEEYIIENFRVNNHNKEGNKYDLVF